MSDGQVSEIVRLPTHKRWTPWLFSLAVSVLALAFSAVVAPSLPLPPLVAFALGFTCVVASALGAALLAPTKIQRRETLWLLPAIAILAAVQGSGALGLPAAIGVALALLAFGSVLGGFVGGSIEHPGHLVFVVVVSSLADTFSVAHPSGPSALIANAPKALALLAISWPMFGTEQIEPLLGVGDVVFTGLYIAATRAHGLPLRRTVIALGLAFLVTMATVISTELPVPALPFLGVAMLIAQPAARRPPERDRTRAIVVVCAISLLFLGLLARRLR